MKFGERQTHAVETDEWLGRGRTKKKKKKQQGGGGGGGEGGGLKGKKQPPMEREGGELGRVEGQRKGGMLRW